MQNPAATGIGIGTQYFPQNGGDPQSCDVSLYETPDVPIALLPGNASAITQWYFDDPANPMKIFLCPGTCSNLGAGSLSIRYGC